jgi:hypothetical protein
VSGLIVAVAYVVASLSPLIMGVLKAQYGLEAGIQVLAAAAFVAGATFLTIIFWSSLKTVQV